LFQGTIDGASVHPRVVVQKAIESNAGAVILFHNHPLC
jgi:DNA repair protein RadC